MLTAEMLLASPLFSFVTFMRFFRHYCKEDMRRQIPSPPKASPIDFLFYKMYNNCILRKVRRRILLFKKYRPTVKEKREDD